LRLNSRAVACWLILHHSAAAYASLTYHSRRYAILSSTAAATAAAAPPAASADTTAQSMMTEVSDGTYSALAYAPRTREVLPPLLVVLHGAGINKLPVWNLADPTGEHAKLTRQAYSPSLLATGRAPAELADNFAVVAPYSFGKASFYDEPRRKLLSFVDWATSDAGRLAGCPAVDPARVFLLGFSDGATVGVELLTTGRFRGGIIAAYGFTGTLPPLAAERLRNVPLWVFHSADDVIFDVANSDRLVRAVRQAGNERVRYTRFERDQEGFTGRVRGHSTGITASKDPAVYEWLLSL
jgi:predicted peptidase